MGIYISIDKAWFNENKEKFAEADDEGGNYVIDSDDLKFDLDEISYVDGNEKEGLVLGFSDLFWKGNSRSSHVYVSVPVELTEQQIKDYLDMRPKLIPSAIEIIVKKFNQVKSLLETAKAL